MNDIKDLEQIYCPQYSLVALKILLDELEQRYCTNQFIDKPQAAKPKRKKTSFIIPDKKYVSSLVKAVEQLVDHVTVIEYELKKAYKGLDEILATGDFEDPEEIMNSVHETIKKYIYGSDSRVDTTDWAKLEKFLLQAGYKQVAVKAGDDINPFRLYFDQPIAADGGTHGTIKSIQLMPFELCYSNGDEIVKLKLCGKCTYFK